MTTTILEAMVEAYENERFNGLREPNVVSTDVIYQRSMAEALRKLAEQVSDLDNVATSIRKYLTTITEQGS